MTQLVSNYLKKTTHRTTLASKAKNIYLLSEVGCVRDSNVLITIKLATEPLINRLTGPWPTCC